MRYVFRSFFLSLVAVTVLFQALPARSAAYPVREIRMIIPWNAGGSNDIMARTIQPLLEKEGIKIIVENIPGGSSVVGLGQVANAKPDGYTLGWATSSLLSVMAEGKVPLTMDRYTSLVRASEDPLLLLVSKDSPHKTIQSFMDHVKANPGKVTVGTPGARSVNDLLSISAARAVDSSIRGVPYPGGSRVVAELMGGQIDAGVLKPGETMQVIASGDLVPLAIFARERSALFPDLPTFQELGYDVFPFGPLTQMSFIVAPANLPADIRNTLVTAFTNALGSREFQDFAQANGFVTAPLSGEELEAEVKGVGEALSSVLKQLDAR